REGLMARHVLVAATDPAAGPLLRQLLRRQGFQLRAADSPARAVALARQHQPDLVVLTSPDLLRDLRFHPETAGLAVLQLGPPVMKTTLHVEPDATVRAPLTSATLAAAIDAALAARAERLRAGIASDLNVWLPSDQAELEAFNDRLPTWLAGCGLTPFHTR